MSMVQCDSNHFYDPRKHTICPHCPVPDLRDAPTPKTMAAPVNRPGSPETEPAFRHRGGDSAMRMGGNYNRAGSANATVGMFQKKAGGINPVVGWLVCIEGVNKGRDYRLHSDRNMVGRAPNMEVCIEGDETISREDHCQVAFSPRTKTFNLIPGTGRNLIYKNGEDVFVPTWLQAYDRIDIGESSFLFVPFCGNDFEWDTKDRRKERDTKDRDEQLHDNRPSDGHRRPRRDQGPVGG